MEFPLESIEDPLKKNLAYLGLCLLIAVTAVAGHNLSVPEEPVRVGLVEVETRCSGLDAGICLGMQRRTHTSYNYDNWTEPEPGTANFYRKVESELMVRAYNVCDEDTTGMEWTSEMEYMNRTADEWLETGEIQLLPCEDTFWRNMTQG